MLQIATDYSAPVHQKNFKSFDSLKELQYDGNILTPEERSELYKDHTKVILEMVEAYHVFSRCIYFNPQMSEKYQNNIDRYIGYYMNIIRHIDIFLQGGSTDVNKVRLSTGSSAVISTQHVQTGTQ